VFCLTEQVGRDELGVGGLVGDHEDLGRAGEEVDPDAAIELPLRLDDVGVARPGDEVDPSDRLCPQRQRGDRLDAAEAVDLVRAGEVHRRDRRRRELARERRSAGGHAVYARDFRRDDAHVCRGDHRIAAARNVRAGARNRHDTVPERDAGKRLHLEIPERSALRLREPAHLRLRETDVLDHLRRQGLDGVSDLVAVEAEALPVPVVEAR
jgi:hypothetical protein